MFIIGGWHFDWYELFEVLTDSSPPSLFRFKFSFDNKEIELEPLKLFFGNWEGRHPMLLQFVDGFDSPDNEEYFNLVERYIGEGVVKKFDHDHDNSFDEFEWIKKKINISHINYL